MVSKHVHRYIIGGMAIFFIVYVLVANAYLSFRDFALYAALPSLVIMIALAFVYRYLENSIKFERRTGTQ
ncbi:hypothetical protein SE19_02810 [Acidiplasma aeolicum]|jgi:hypothetical protein|uniref:Uncharacterized protein n=4 Tax=Thermoplasmatales TaxID=2301 RepID=A0A0Q0VNQ2_9ARCH|nr:MULTISPECIES: hypothetical protein [Thermoplasmatales]EQB64367.1 MAG: hypothetical protein AMDU3_IPLC00005G0023 [Thermoplasmatales archaeon I-plasma]MCI2413058.1 hypothetical protein [Cuniculiplasma sp.]MCY0851463.1 hypothetical protein [Thermoplasma acidophilum]EQB73248.1 MAG: hypothetical protein AMDU4_FER2C00086G0034 [Ferroplasma sp. Type II]KPV47044.1 hypothetical protein SE19_02810 [Acidiplasma aeolicum]